jgi:hypothetical protein
MDQVAQFLAGERDYTAIKGGTGPLVYPAAHVYTYSLLYKLTDQGRDVFLAQLVFASVYLAALGVAMACYRRAGVSLGGIYLVDMRLSSWDIDGRLAIMGSLTDCRCSRLPRISSPS